MTPASAPEEESAGLYARRELKAIAARWDAKAATWDSELAAPDCHLNEDQGYARFIEHARATIEENRAFCAANGAIDAGCGTGLVLEQLVAAFQWGLGIDLSQEMIAVAKLKQLPNTRFLVGDCFHLASLCPPAGAIFSRGVLLSHYGPRHGEALLRAARQTLVSGGLVLFDFLNAEARGSNRHSPENKTYYTGQEVEAMAARAGLGKALVLGSRQRRARVLRAQKVD